MIPVRTLLCALAMKQDRQNNSVIGRDKTFFIWFKYLVRVIQPKIIDYWNGYSVKSMKHPEMARFLSSVYIRLLSLDKTLFMNKFLYICLVSGFLGACNNPDPHEKRFVDVSGIDSSIKPGDNFFRYVNGRWYDT